MKCSAQLTRDIWSVVELGQAAYSVTHQRSHFVPRDSSIRQCCELGRSQGVLEVNRVANVGANRFSAVRTRHWYTICQGSRAGPNPIFQQGAGWYLIFTDLVVVGLDVPHHIWRAATVEDHRYQQIWILPCIRPLLHTHSDLASSRLPTAWAIGSQPISRATAQVE